ncbi:Na+/H+ antiporter NhaA [Sphingosinicellaceae bacterium]|nr:Na+/H+ antiporter NhaA [Sphingosinicellaceae bacterium]
MRQFLRDEAAGGYLLMAAAAAAVLAANTALAVPYHALFDWHFAGHTLVHWINDGLMALFFLLVGLEIKRETLDGELSTWSRRLLPGAAALAGMIVPALVYIAVNHGSPANLRGWAIPAATDIAFALAILAMLGSRVPASLKLLVTAIAIIDDLGAIVVIAVAYTDAIHWVALAGAGVGLAGLALLNRSGVRAVWPYLVVGVLVWFAVLQSGVHATLAGVAVAMTIPMNITPGAPEDRHSPLIRLEHGLSPWIAFAVVPLFGFANAGLDLRGVTPASLLEPLPLGVALGLLLGKQFGVFGAIWALVRSGAAARPAGASWRQLYGVALLCGIGFTMSLFISGLAFGDSAAAREQAKLGIIAGSLLAALGGWLVLAGGTRERRT